MNFIGNGNHCKGSSYNQMVLRGSSIFLMTLAVLSCTNNNRSKEKVQEAILNRLQTRSGLDLKSLDVHTTDVSFDKNMAFATVSFHPKDNVSVASAMTMRYTLEFRDGKWAVVKVADAHGASGAHGATDSLPPGHPSGNGPGQRPEGAPTLPPTGTPQATGPGRLTDDPG